MGCGLCSNKNPATKRSIRLMRGRHLGAHASSVQTLWVRQHSLLLGKLSLNITREICTYLAEDTRKLVFLDLHNSQVKYFDVDRKKWQHCWKLRYTSEKQYYFRRAEQYAWTAISEYIIFVCGGMTPAIWNVGGGYYEGKVCIVHIGNDAFFLKDDEREYPIPRMGVARYGHAILYHTGKVYVFGGVRDLAGEHPIRICEKYLVSSNEWQALPDMHEARYCFNPCWYLSVVYLCGGWKTSVEIFNPVSNIITLLPELILPEEGQCIAVVSCEGKLVVLTENYLCKVHVWGLEKKRHSPYKHYAMSPPLVLREIAYIADNPYCYGIRLDTGELANV